MSVQALSAVFALKIESPTVKLVLLALANYSDADGRCWPSQAKLCAVTSLSERTVRSALESLEQGGFITKTQRRRADGSRATDIINLVFLQPANAAGSEQPAYVAASATGNSRRNNRQMAPEQPATPAPLTTFEPSREPSSLSRLDRDQQMLAEVRQAAGDALACMATTPGVANLQPLKALLAGVEPCDWHLDVLPAVTSAAAWHRQRESSGGMKSWTLAVRLARENRVNRLNPPPVEPARVRPSAPSGPDPRTSARLERFADFDAASRAALRQNTG